MAAIITSKTRIYNAEQIFESFSEAEVTRQYLFVGRPQPWSNELAPDTPIDSVKQDYEVRRDMLAAKRILPSDVSLGILRRNWTTGKYYDLYRDDYDGSTVQGVNIDTGAATFPETLFDANFYVVTDEFNVYKCIWNASGVQSTVKPTGTSLNEFTTADGYVWKYMYTIAPSDVLKFVSTDFIPVKRIINDPGVADFYYGQYQVEQAAIDGALSRILVVAGGTGYPISSTTIPVVIVGDGVGATATATSNSSGQITSVQITNKGTGYTFATVSIGGGGTGASAQAIMQPKGGHGKDATRELGGYYVLLNVRLGFEDGSGDFPSVNDYRRIGILRDPTEFGTSVPLLATTVNATKSLTLGVGVTGTFAPDSVITGGSSAATATVVSYNSTTRVLNYVQVGSQIGTFTVGETISSGANSGVVSALGNPEMNVQSGELVYLEHRRQIVFQEASIADIKITIEA